MASTIFSGAMVAGSVKHDKPSLERQKFMLAALKDNLHLPRLAQLIAAGGVKLTMDCFRNERDPYGRPWKPLARERTRDRRARLAREKRGLKSRGHKILTDTARMRNSTAPIWRGNQGGVAISTGYAASHQNGAHINPHSRIGSRDRLEIVKGRARAISQSRRTFAQGITIPQRMMLPDSVLLPESWERMISRESTGLMKRWLQKGSVL
jgi:phage gpG-like protein